MYQFMAWAQPFCAVNITSGWTLVLVVLLCADTYQGLGKRVAFFRIWKHKEKTFKTQVLDWEQVLLFCNDNNNAILLE